MRVTTPSRPLAACGRRASIHFDGLFPAYGQCIAAKMVLSCEYTTCLSDDETQCRGSAKLGADADVPFACAQPVQTAGVRIAVR